MKSYCVKQKKQTKCVEPSGYKTAKNGRLMFFFVLVPSVVLKKLNLSNRLQNQETVSLIKKKVMVY